MVSGCVAGLVVGSLMKLGACVVCYMVVCWMGMGGVIGVVGVGCTCVWVGITASSLCLGSGGILGIRGSGVVVVFGIKV